MTTSSHSQAAAMAAAIQGLSVRSGQNTPTVRGADWQTATVTAVNSDGTVDVGEIRARRLESYLAPAVGDRIMLTQSGNGNWIAPGRTASAATALGLPQYRFKLANTDRTSTTALADDPDLTIQLDANATYVVEFHLFLGGPSGALPVTAWNAPSGASGLKGVQGAGSAATDSGADNIAMHAGSHGFATTVTYGRRNVNTNLLYAQETAAVTTADAGTCAIQWAQSASSSTAVRMGRGSWMRVTRIA